MVTKRFVDMPLMRVTRSELTGQNRRLTLACGHTKLIGSKVPVPHQSHCQECPK